MVNSVHNTVKPPFKIFTNGSKSSCLVRAYFTLDTRTQTHTHSVISAVRGVSGSLRKHLWIWVRYRVIHTIGFCVCDWRLVRCPTALCSCSSLTVWKTWFLKCFRNVSSCATLKGCVVKAPKQRQHRGCKYFIHHHHCNDEWVYQSSVMIHWSLPVSILRNAELSIQDFYCCDWTMKYDNETKRSS